MFSKILIANRGEIACRIERTCRRLGVATVAVYSDADARSQHVLGADEGVWIGSSAPTDSYLQGQRIIDAALTTGAQAIHPGFGFLSENADFADTAEKAGLKFIGPRSASMRKMGSKAGAKELMAAAGVPVVPGYTGSEQTTELLHAEALRVGFPLMIKAAHGGGGKGMRVVRTADEFLTALASCQREAKGAFGRDRVLLERYVERPRHIEFQIFGDRTGDVLHLNERECSAQRRYQKIYEESPSMFLTPELRSRMGAAAVLAGQAIDYENAGTVEFIVGQGGDFYFMEINTRLQVEHPVTELCTGLDLVELQLRIASGERLADLLPERPVPTRGHAIEVRLYAEDPDQDFLPGSGRLEVLQLPQVGNGVRLDGGVVEGDLVTVHYDPMIAKLIVHDVDRPKALAKLRGALAETLVVGPKSNVGFLERLIRHSSIVDASIDTSYLDRHLAQVRGEMVPPSVAAIAAAAACVLQAQEQDSPRRAMVSGDPHSPWALADGWRVGHAGKRLLRLEVDGNALDIAAHGAFGDYHLRWSGGECHARGVRAQGNRISMLLGERAVTLQAVDAAGAVFVHDGDHRWRFELRNPFAANTQRGSSENRIKSPMPGRIVAVRVAIGDAVTAGQEVIVMEAMKMELSLKAPREGVVAELRAITGEFVEADATLIRLD